MAKMKQGDDPKDFNSDEVTDYLKTADDAERKRVYDAEAGEGGKQRKGILETQEAAEAEAGDSGDGVGSIAPPQGGVSAADVEANPPPDEEATVQRSTNDEDNDLANPYTHDAAEQAAVERAKAQKIY